MNNGHQSIISVAIKSRIRNCNEDTQSFINQGIINGYRQYDKYLHPLGDIDHAAERGFDR